MGAEATMAAGELPAHGVGAARPDFATLWDMFDHAVSAAPAAIAVRCEGVSLTYAQEGQAVTYLARYLADIASPGVTVALVLPNSIAFRIAYFAALRARTVPALLNPTYPAAQLAPLLRGVHPHVVICQPAARDAVMAAASGSRAKPRLIALDDETATEPGPDRALDREAPTPEEVAALMFSGGTTGLPKIVEHTHARLVVAARWTEYAWPTRLGGDVWLPIAPFTHIYGFLQGLLAPISAQGEVIIPARFKPELVVELMERHRVTVFGGGPPAIYAGMLAATNLAGSDLSALRVCPAGGAPMPAELAQRWRRSTGTEIHEGYGMTEMAPISATNALTGVRLGSVGKPLPCNEVQIVDVETGERVLPPGERGEVRVRGPHMMTGYRDHPEETRATIRDGFIHTGDIGHLDADGFLFITDRKKDVVFVSGFNVFPREVEEVIYAHRKVAAAAAVGTPDERTGERLAAYVVPHVGEALTAEELAEFLGQRLVAYKRPRVIEIVEALPMTSTQKVDRSALRRREIASASARGPFGGDGRDE